MVAAALSTKTAFAQSTEFNTQLLGIGQGTDVNLSHFAHPGYIVPGTYAMMIKVNRTETETRDITFHAQSADGDNSSPCFTPDIISLIGFNKSGESRITYDDNGCADLNKLEGAEVKGDLPTRTLSVVIPDIFMELAYPGWVPPQRWDTGISGVLIDYDLNLAASHSLRGDGDTRTLRGLGTVGANAGAWRLRADWQGARNFDRRSQQRNEWDWNRLYAFRPLPMLGARLTLGEDYYGSGIFDTFRFTGASVVSDERMLPPTLRGYSPEINGVARTNALVIISQKGHVVAEKQVAAGPFTIRDLSRSVTGELDVTVQEQDGTEQRFTVQTATIPYLTRPGQVRYKVVVGEVSDYQRSYTGDIFGGGEFSWGVSNGWSLFGGMLASNDYTAIAAGMGRDLYALGAISADVTQSNANLGERRYAGKSWRVNYSKRFDEYDSQVTFAGYRFSEREFLSLSDFSRAIRYGNKSLRNSKEMFTVSFNKNFRDSGINATLNYTHQIYWNHQESDNYNFMLSSSLDIGPVKNASVSVSVFENDFYGQRDKGGYLSISMPLAGQSRATYSADISRKEVRHSVGFSHYEDGSHYQLNAGTAKSGQDVSAYYSRNMNAGEFSLNAGYQPGSYASAGASLRGAATLTAEGGALHRQSTIGGTRMMVDTGGVKNIPISTNGNLVYSNRFGKAVLTDINHYIRSEASVDTTKLPDDAEVISPVTHVTLTEGAIGYRKLGVISGQKGMSVIRLADGSWPPFGAVVTNRDGVETGIVDDKGSVYLSGIRPDEKMQVTWGDYSCGIVMPSPLPNLTNTELLLPCQQVPTQHPDGVK
ncbi:fimbria/pilus outer membrane usher protein [Enterobacter bugandensis]|uniref:fimbria/pilus outer membrane usher protein n=1 Tax=Enterobacter bugandensis TaxID=881260 RepID=UPI002FD6405C